MIFDLSKLPEMKEEVDRLMAAKKFHPDRRSEVLAKMHLRTEICEIFDEWKKQAFSRPEEMAKEIAGVAIRTFNFWYNRPYPKHIIEGWSRHRSKGYAGAIRHIELDDRYNGDEGHLYILDDMQELVSLYEDGNMCTILVFCVLLCEKHLEIPFEDAFRIEMDKNWARPIQFNTAKEHYADDRQTA